MRLEFHPRDYQLPIIRALNSGTKRAVWVVHRRGGKDVTAFNWCILQLLLNPAWTAFHILPTYSQAKKVIWDSSTNDGQRILDYIPKEIIESKNGQEMKIRFTNGSMYQLIGSDNIDSLVGTNPKIIIFSEYAIQSPAAWNYLRPILDVNKGYALFISTPRGKNHFYDLVCMARNNPKWFCEVLSVRDTGVLSDEDIQQIRNEGVNDEFIEQEYYCSFNRGVEGSYYGRLIEKAREEKRICNIPYETRSPVHTAWDIGFGDSTSVTFWQEIGGELRIIDFYEAQGEGIAHYAKMLQSKPYTYGSHYMPHDAGSGSIQTGRTLQEVAYEQGIKTVILARETDIQVGIEAVRQLLSISYIDETKCRHLIKCLENYHKKYNEKTQSYSESPLHDWTSHAADSARYMANARIQYGRGPGSLTPDKLTELKSRAGFGANSTQDSKSIHREIMDFFNDCKTQDEAKKTYHLLVKHFHPDKGGDSNLMVELKEQYEKWSPSRFKFNKTNWQNQFPDHLNDDFNKFESRADREYIALLENRIEKMNKENDQMYKDLGIYVEMNFFQRIIFVIFGEVYVKSKKNV